MNQVTGEWLRQNVHQDLSSISTPVKSIERKSDADTRESEDWATTAATEIAMVSMIDCHGRPLLIRQPVLY
jgi:uncharacterized protein YacL (UPF0231 family)